MSWKVEVVDGRSEGRRDDDIKTTHDIGDRFVVNGTVGRCKTVIEIWFHDEFRTNIYLGSSNKTDKMINIVIKLVFIESL
jgi:hypothetical protein